MAKYKSAEELLRGEFSPIPAKKVGTTKAETSVSAGPAKASVPVLKNVTTKKEYDSIPYGPATASTPKLQNTVNVKKALYEKDDKDLSPREILTKYEYVANDTDTDDKTKSKLISQGKKSLAKVIKSNPDMDTYQKVSELQTKLQAQTKSGAFASGFWDEMSALKDFAAKRSALLTEQNKKLESQLEQAKAAQSGYYSGGQMAGELAKQAGMYTLVGGIGEAALPALAKQVPGMQKVMDAAGKNALTRFGSGVLAQQAVDTAAMQPLVVAEGMAEGKSREEIIQDMKSQAFMDLVFNAGFGILGEGGKAIAGRAKKSKAAQAATKAVKDLSLEEEYRMLKDPDYLTKQFGEIMEKDGLDAAHEFGRKASDRLKEIEEEMETAKKAGGNIQKSLTPEEEYRQLRDGDYLNARYREIFEKDGEEAAYDFIRQVDQRQKELEKQLVKPSAKGTQAEQSLKSELKKELSSLLSYSGKENRATAKKAIEEAMTEVRRTGTLSQETRENLYRQLLNLGEISNEGDIDKEIRDILRKTKVSISKEDAANIADYGKFRQSTMGKIGAIDTNGKHTPIDTLYGELAERFPQYFSKDITHPADQLQQMVNVAENMKERKTPLKDALDKEGELLLRQEFDEILDRAVGGFQKLNQFDAERKTRKLREIMEMPPEDLNYQQIQEIYKQRYQTKKAYEKFQAKNVLTEGEQAILQKMLAGEISEDTVKNLPGFDTENLLKAYETEKPYRQAQKTITQYKKSRKAAIRENVETMTGNLDIRTNQKAGWKDRNNWKMARETQERILDQVAPDKETAERIKKQLFEPIHTNERDKQLFIRDTAERIKKLGIDTKKRYTVPVGDSSIKLSESGMVQFLGENRYRLQQLQGKKMLKKGELEEKKALEDMLANAEKLLNAKQKEKINTAIAEIQQIYKEIHPKINETLLRNGYDPVGYIDGYFPHMFFDDASDPMGKALQRLGFDFESKELPMDIAGRTETFKPGKKWSGNLLSREGTSTDYDALRALEKYLDDIGDVVYHTDDIQKLRAYEDNMRYQLSPEGVKEEVNKIRARDDLDELEKQIKIDAEYEKVKGHSLQNYVNNIRMYTDLLAGKKHPLDRFWENNFFSRKVYKAMNTIENKVAANMVGGNIGSALTNFIPITQGMATTSKKNAVKGLEEALIYMGKDGMDDLTRKSAFLATREGQERLYRTGVQKFSDFISKPMEIADKFSTQAVWRAKYYDLLGKGMEEKEAVLAADNFARNLFAGRSKGAMPTIFSSKMAKPLTMFQLEVNNQLDFLLKDIPKEQNGNIRKIMNSYAQIVIGSYLYNDVYEKITGRRSALDPWGFVNETVGDFTGERMRNTLDILSDLASGNGFVPFEETEELGGSQAVEELLTRTGEQMPFIGGLFFDGGRIPLSSAGMDIPEIAGAWADVKRGDASSASARDKTLKEVTSSLLYLLPPAGGGQIRKSLDGLKTMQEGGSYSSGKKGDKLQFAVDQEDPLAWVQAGIFGKWALPEGREYIENGFKGLSVNKTKEQIRMNELYGTSAKKYMEVYNSLKSIDSKKEKYETLMSQRLSRDESEFFYSHEILSSTEEWEEYNFLKNKGLSYNDAAKIQMKIQSIEESYRNRIDLFSDSAKEQRKNNEIYDYINSTSLDQKIKNELFERFCSKATKLTKKWETSGGVLSVDDFERLSLQLKKLSWETDNSYEKNTKQINTIKQFTPGMSSADRRKLYEAFGVAKSYWYW
ncbi:hypothetical protein H9X85_02250 [Anaerotignum lactatifermentans]|uniref:Barnase-EndoU-ColicinE5/D-RelE like domain-containing protein n=1 Tax=Anaerotignum lactatifermentans TaxID=160404 RepID=A0ABS2GA00_9FIRM|nr:hypothetical protein [Anaerotignum lactatifermentans]MBM6828453.1 hypothetical protein [Anaerotignum lactatifermentans]MBM6877860.1 hypothetical protein [Anaerotignum lactatifermentans]MBM6950036.1 hypothetical protein [Anaerotignum lactatifermentans]